ncbi:MAG: hypothetical protein HY820_07250 [Acidobacteria bacterium]|nr:hypothetical protein [Acidobacteriota bacterium]
MFANETKSTGTQYTLTVALLALAFVFSPAVLLLSGRTGYLPISVAVASSALCVILAYVNWTRNSRLTIPTIQTPETRQ